MNTAERKGVLSVGAIMVDTVCHVPRLPKSGEAIVASQTQTHLGGCAFNSGNMVRQLGVPCFLLAPLGQGIHAEFARKELAARNLDAVHVETQLDNGSCVCFVEPDGERTMLTTSGIERHFSANWFEDIDASLFSVGFASGYEIDGTGGDAIISFFEQHPSIAFIYAPGPCIMNVSEQKMERLFALKPMWHLNDLEATRYAKERLGLAAQGDVFDAGQKLATACSNTVVVTLGSDGSAAFFPDGTHVHVASSPVTPIDTVGAGDAHLGALSAAISAGATWEKALDLANKAAAAVCLTAGATLLDEDFAAYGLSMP